MLPKYLPDALVALEDLGAEQDVMAEVIPFGSMPVRDRVADRLADAMCALDEVIGILGEEGASSIRSMDTDVKSLFEGVDRLMRQVSD